MQRLEPPAGGHKLGGQPVEQLGMAGRVAHDAEIVRRGDEPLAKMELPDPVDDHARRQRVLGAGQPASQPEPAAGRTWRSACGGSGCRRTRTAGTPGSTTLPGRVGSPRLSTWVSGAFGPSSDQM